MTAALERSTALCISEMNRVFDSYTLRSEARRLANGGISLIEVSVNPESGSAWVNYEMEEGEIVEDGEILEGYGAVHDTNFRDDGSYDEEVYAAAKAVGAGMVEYDYGDNPLILDKKKIEPISALDHSSIDYKPFHKDFYEDGDFEDFDEWCEKKQKLSDAHKRSGSAPPIVEGSLNAVGGLFNHGVSGVGPAIVQKARIS